MDISMNSKDELEPHVRMIKPKVIKQACLALFYCSLVVLGMSVLFSSKDIQLIIFFTSVFLGISLFLSVLKYCLLPIYLVNFTMLVAATSVPFITSNYDVTIIIFIPLIVGNKFLLKDSTHFWCLLVINVLMALFYILFANQSVHTTAFIVEGIVFFLNIFILIRILLYADQKEKSDKIKIYKQLAFLQGIVDINPQLIYAKSKEGKFTFVNKLFAESIGLPKEEIVGKTDFDIGLPKDKTLSSISRDIEVMDTGLTNQMYEEVVDEEGEVSYFQSIRAPLTDENNNITGVLGVSMDRSAEKRSEKKLFGAKLLYQALFDNLNDGVIIYDYLAEKIYSCNDSAMQMFRFDKNTDVTKYNRFQFFPQEINGVDVHEELADHRERILNSQIIKGKAIMRRSDEELFECNLSVYPSPGKNGQGIIVVQDVSEAVKAKRGTLKSKNYFMQIYDNSPVAISMTDISTMKVHDINATHRKVFGYSLDKLQSLNINDLVPNFNYKAQNRIIKKLGDGEIEKHVLERDFININGEKLKVRTSQSVIKRDGKEYLMEFMEDITELYKQEARYKFLFENAFDGIVVNDYEKREIIQCNTKFKEFLKLDASRELKTYNTLNYSPALQDNGLSSKECLRQNFIKVKELGSLDFNWKFKLKDGSIKYADISLIHQEVDQKKLTYAIYRETTNERLTQKALKESEKRFRLIFDNAFDGLYFFNYKTQKLIQANRRLYELFETTPDRILIDNPHLKPEFQPDGTSTLDKIKTTLIETLEKGKSRATRIYVKSDGKIIHLEISTFLLSPPDNDIIVSIYKDITDQKRAEEMQILSATQEEKLGALRRELSSYTLFTTQKNRLLQELSEDLRLMTNLESGESKKMVEKVRRKITVNLDEKEDWMSFKTQFERVHPGFFNQIEKSFNNLSTNDLKHLAYVKMGLSNSEIADVLFVGKKAVEMSHYRLKKKMGFEKNLTLKQAIKNI